jgi:hypothetical protein
VKALRILPEVAADGGHVSANLLAQQLGFFQAHLGFAGLDNSA